MDFDSSSKFIASLARFLQSLCNGYVEFDKGVEVIGHIYLSVDSDTGRKIDYVLNEKVCKNDNSVTFISNSFHAQPAEKPKPAQKKSDSENRNEDSVVMDDSGQSTLSSTKPDGMGTSQDGSYPSNKRPRSPFQRRMGMGRGSGVPPTKSPRYQDASPAAKSGHLDIPSSNNLLNSGEEYDNSYGGDEDYSNTDIDQKPIIEPDISIVKEEYMSNQQQGGASYNPGNVQPSGPGRGRVPSSVSAPYATAMHPNSPAYSSPGDYSSPSIEPRDPSVAMGSQVYGFQLTKRMRRRYTAFNELYTSSDKEQIGKYGFMHGASAAAKYFSRTMGKRIPRTSVQNFVNMIKKKQFS